MSRTSPEPADSPTPPDFLPASPPATPLGTPPVTPRRWLGAALLFAATFLLSAAVILSGRVGTGESADQINYHVPVVRSFAAQWPSPDFTKYDSATTPGYHVTMALLWRLTGGASRWSEAVPEAPVGAGPTPDYPRRVLNDAEREDWRTFLRDLVPLQLFNALLGSGLIAVVYWLASRFTPWWLAVVLTLPLALNQYVLGASIWLTTDNAGWFLALGALGCAAALPGARGIAAGGAWAAVGVLVRQVHVWVCGPIALAALLAWLVGRAEDRRRTFVAGVVACAVPTAIVAGFALAWGGLTPPSPRIREVHGHGINPAAIPFALSLFAAYGLMLFPAWRDQLGTVIRHRTAFTGLALVGVLSAVAFATSTQQPTLTDPPMRGYGWLWRASALFPAVSDRSLAFVVGAPVGLVVLALMFRGARARGHGGPALVLVVGLGCWLLAQVMNPAAWQRYFDPIVLALAAWLAALAAPRHRWRALMIGALVLALFMAALSARSIGNDLRRDELPFDGGVLKMQGKL